MARILFVDDDPEMIDLCRSYLSKTPYEVMSAKDPMEALELLYNYTIDVLVLDANMPFMTGFELLERLRRTPRFKSLCITFLTGRSKKEDIQRALKLGANDYLLKPIEKAAFIEKIKSLVPQQPLSENMRYAIPQGSGVSEGSIPLDVKIVSISDYGLEILSPIRFLENKTVELQTKLFESIGIATPNMTVMNVLPEGENQWRTILAFGGLEEESLKKMQDWFLLMNSLGKKKPA